MEQLVLQTLRRSQMIDITAQVRSVIQRSGVKNGICTICSLHTTAGITVNENADPDVVNDMLLWLNRTIPQQQEGFRHGEGNSDSHIKTTLVGTSATLIIADGDLMLGRWQGVWFCEFDGPRTRQIAVRVLGTATQ